MHFWFHKLECIFSKSQFQQLCDVSKAENGALIFLSSDFGEFSSQVSSLTFLLRFYSNKAKLIHMNKFCFDWNWKLKTGSICFQFHISKLEICKWRNWGINFFCNPGQVEGLEISHFYCNSNFPVPCTNTFGYFWIQHFWIKSRSKNNEQNSPKEWFSEYLLIWNFDDFSLSFFL